MGLHWFAVVGLAILPGAPLAVALRGDVSPATRLALAVAISPAAAALAWVPLVWMGVETGLAAWLVVAFSVALTLPAATRLLGRPHAMIPLLLAMSAGVLWVSAHWFSIPGLRLFGWHNLLHLETIQSILRSGAAPEEPALAGVAIGYGWIGFAHVAATSAVSDRTATLLFPCLNLLLLGATVLLTAAAARAVDVGRGWAASAGALALLGGNVVSDAAGLFGADAATLREIFGDPRLHAAVSKFLYLDQMPVSFALLSAAMWLGLRLQQAGSRDLIAVGSACLLALAVLYPAAAPAGASIACGLAAASWLAPLDGKPGRGWVTAFASVAVLGILGTAWWWGTGPAVEFSEPSRMADKGVHLSYAVGPFLLAAAPAVYAAFRDGAPGTLGLSAATVVLLLAYPLIDATGLEYKLVMYARIPLAILVASGASRVSGSAIAAVGIPALAGILSFSTSMGRLPPPTLGNAPPAVEAAALMLSPSSPDSEWVEAIRRETPEDSVVVARGASFAVGAFADRSLYLPAFAKGSTVAGHSLDTRYNLLRLRGHPRPLLAERASTVQAIFEGRSAARVDPAMRRLRNLGRPIVFVARATLDSELASHLGRHGAVQLHDDEQASVWLMDSHLPQR